MFNKTDVEKRRPWGTKHFVTYGFLKLIGVKIKDVGNMEFLAYSMLVSHLHDMYVYMVIPHLLIHMNHSLLKQNHLNTEFS